MTEYMEDMREREDAMVGAELFCWFLLNGGTRACIKERGHDAGVHEGPSELHCGDAERAHQPHTWTATHQCLGAG